MLLFTSNPLQSSTEWKSNLIHVLFIIHLMDFRRVRLGLAGPRAHSVHSPPSLWFTPVLTLSHELWIQHSPEEGIHILTYPHCSLIFKRNVMPHMCWQASPHTHTHVSQHCAVDHTVSVLGFSNHTGCCLTLKGCALVQVLNKTIYSSSRFYSWLRYS